MTGPTGMPGPALTGSAAGAPIGIRVYDNVAVCVPVVTMPSESVTCVGFEAAASTADSASGPGCDIASATTAVATR